jgi:DNA-binding NtrC family response regulator
MKNAIERAVVMGRAPEIGVADLPAGGRQTNRSGVPAGVSFKAAVEAFKRDFLARSLEHSGGNRSLAARSLGIQRTYLSRLLAKYRLQHP